jgi:hypothetical protein
MKSMHWRIVARFVLGTTLGILPLLVVGESYLQFSPPKDVLPYLGDASPLTDVFVPDDDFVVAYRSWDAFCAVNQPRLQEYLPFEATNDRCGTWAFFGNSFVQAPGMLADHARTALPDRRVFNLGRNEDLLVRLAQIRILLENGMKPERVFFLLLPVDLLRLGEQPLDTIRVSSNGAIGYQPRLPKNAFGRWLVQHSRLGLISWVRAGRHRGNPHFRKETLYDRVDQPLLADVVRLSDCLRRWSEVHAVPVTVILPPAIHQVLNGASFGFQDTLGAVFRERGLDVLDPRDEFLRQADADLFLPDKHFSARGNQLLLSVLLTQVRMQESVATATLGAPRR